ncbi:phage terminase, large subunit, PBSX family [Paenibacillus algorifonticola]|uniref:Phage terminase, large subunit, PBSX family n=1 Tax=Paenibacillus algorifonticola TaxID=684063 RepID=A0A1I2AIR2_9BACL|nr:PBSX family phage terminase large subunit [Paenibacillus algorifonticola]SFE43786.1 phage terminase, large subunit, PBSX family [Paenibacillus algorifonticola]
MAKLLKPTFRWKPFSRKQLQVLTWWMPESPHHDKDAIICDGSVRAGKTASMSFSYIVWAMETFNGQQLGMSGKTIGSLRRNVIIPLKLMLVSRGYKVFESRSENTMTVTSSKAINTFYLFGGRDERSQDLIQGVTLAGMFFDEVALMPQSFVNQATARCSVDDSKIWFNCNPAGPFHWFKLEWLDQIIKKHALHIHFTMDDNPSLSERVKARYRRDYSGVFYKRFVLGLWVLADGIIYDMWDDDENTFDDDDLVPGFKHLARRYIAIDYGTSNPMVYLDIWDDGDVCWILHEYYYDSRAKGIQKDDSQYAGDFETFVGIEHPPIFTVLDPSAASFKVALRNRGYRVKDADNEVEDGIRMMATMIAKRKIRVHRTNCPNFLKERASYVWDKKAGERGIEKPVKQLDHAMDGGRYFVKTIIKPRRIAAA